jgi:type IV pilus assembly protein PilM
MQRLIVCEVGSFAVKAMELEISKKRRPPLWLAHKTLPEDADVNSVGAMLAELLRDVDTRNRHVRLVISHPDMAVRSLSIPSANKAELEIALGYAVTEALPLPLDDLIVDYEGCLKRSSESVDVVTVGVPKSVVYQAVSVTQSAGLKLEAIDAGPLCAARAATALKGRDASFYLVEVGSGSTTIEVIQSGSPKLVRTLAIGGAKITRELAHQLGLTMEAAEGLKRVGHEESAQSVIDSEISEIVEEVASSIEYFTIQQGIADISSIVLTGGSASLATLKAKLAERTGLEVEQPGPRSVLRLVEGDSLFEDANGNWVELVGAGLRVLDKHHKAEKRINLLPPEMKSQGGAGRYLALAGTGALITAAVLAVPSFVQMQAISAQDAQNDTLNNSVAVLNDQVSALSEYGVKASTVQAAEASVQATLKGAVPWAQVLYQIGASFPSDSWLTQLQLQSQQASSTVQSGSGATLSFQVQGCSQFAPVHWLQNMNRLPFLTQTWVSSSNLQSPGKGCPGTSSSPEAGLTSYSGQAQILPVFGEYLAEQYLLARGIKRW